MICVGSVDVVGNRLKPPRNVSQEETDTAAAAKTTAKPAAKPAAKAKAAAAAAAEAVVTPSLFVHQRTDGSPWCCSTLVRYCCLFTVLVCDPYWFGGRKGL